MSMATTPGEIVVHSSNAVGADVEALVQAAVSVLSNDMQVRLLELGQSYEYGYYTRGDSSTQQ